MAEATGFRALYLSGGGVAANSLGLPDLGISTMDDVLIDIRRITEASTLAAAGGCGHGLGRRVQHRAHGESFIKAGAAGMHIEDQVQAKRCGHRPGKEVVPREEMVDRVKAAVDARTDGSFVIMARSDALASEGLDRMIERLVACVDAGADAVFPEAITDLAMYRKVRDAVKVPVLANITEFGKTPLYTREELGCAGVDIVLHCCSAYRAMNLAALKVYQAIRRDGTQKNVLADMQTRDDLYKYLDYHAYEQQARRACSPARRRRGEMSAPKPPRRPFKPKKSVALSGVTAGNTALCSVGRSGNDLHYRGYDILEVAETCEFEEIAYLLIHGKLPNQSELTAYKAKLKNLRGIPAPVRAVLEQLPPGTHPMDVMRTGASALGCVLPEANDHDAAGRARDRRSPAGLLSVDALLLVSLLAQQPPHPRRDRRRFGGRPFPAPAASAAAVRELGARDAHLADSLRRTRVQFLHVHGARDRRHGLGHLLLHHRRHRRAARTETRRRQRGRAGDPGALRHARRGRGRHPPARGRTRKSSSASATRCTPWPTRATWSSSAWPRS